jgi:hypothetical protein
MRQMVSVWRLSATVVVISAAILAAGVGTAKANFCYESVNPSGGPAVGDNHTNILVFPGTINPFGNDAVPGGKDTSPGNNGNGPLNSDGFYVIFGYLFSGSNPNPIPVPAALGGGTHWPVTWIKYTQRGNPNIDVSPFSGPNSAVTWHIQAPDDLYVNAPRGSEGAESCLVPPPPF